MRSLTGNQRDQPVSATGAMSLVSGPVLRNSVSMADRGFNVVSHCRGQIFLKTARSALRIPGLR